MWKRIQLAYVRFCRRYGPGGLTYSAWAWKRHQAGRPFMANRIDGLALLIFGQRDHCAGRHKREAATSIHQQ